MDLVAVEKSITLTLAVVASALAAASLIRILARGPYADPEHERLRRTDLLWTAVPVLLLGCLLGALLYSAA